MGKPKSVIALLELEKQLANYQKNLVTCTRGADSFGLEGRAIAGDKLDLRLRGQPPRRRFIGTIRQKVNDVVRFVIDDDRPVPMPLTQCKIIDTEHTRGQQSLKRHCPHAP